MAVKPWGKEGGRTKIKMGIETGNAHDIINKILTPHLFIKCWWRMGKTTAIRRSKLMAAKWNTEAEQERVDKMV